MMLALDGIQCRYGNVRVLDQVSLRLGTGEILGLLGRNGAGKTTLLKTIMGLMPPVSGSIQLDGNELTGLPAHEIPKHGIGYVPQGRRLFPWLTVAENLKMGLLVRNSSPDTLEWVLELFPVLKERLEQNAGTLSGGEQQMVATARALCLQPRILLLDEPSEGLMPALLDKVFETVERVKQQQVGILLVEQKIEGVLRIADRITFLENGAVQHETDPKTLQADPEPLYRYVGVRC